MLAYSHSTECAISKSIVSALIKMLRIFISLKLIKDTEMDFALSRSFIAEKTEYRVLLVICDPA